MVGWLPPELQNYIVFTASIGAAARQPHAAQTLLNLLTSSTGIALFKAYRPRDVGQDARPIQSPVVAIVPKMYRNASGTAMLAVDN
jgi:hypothetical protein